MCGWLEQEGVKNCTADLLHLSKLFHFVFSENNKTQNKTPKNPNHQNKHKNTPKPPQNQKKQHHNWIVLCSHINKPQMLRLNKT